MPAKNHRNTASGSPTVIGDHIVSGLRTLGVRPGDSLLVHSSLSQFGYVEGGADTVIDALLAAVGDTGNVIVPTFTGRREDGPSDPPVFDIRRTPCWTGRIPNVFLQHPQAQRSLHPTHSVAGIGPLVPQLIADHLTGDSPCGPQSPFYRLAQHDGYILLLGVDHNSNTTVHTAEELAQVPYHMQHVPTDTVVIDYDGLRRVQRMLLHEWGTARDFQRIDKPLKEQGFMKMGTIGRATVRLVRAHPMLQWLTDELRRHPKYLVR